MSCTITASDRDTHIRSGGFATVERIGDHGEISARLDNGKSLELNPEMARHVEYGYAIEGLPREFVDRVLLTGNAAELAQQQDQFARLSLNTRDLALYTSGRREFALAKTIPNVESVLSLDGLASRMEKVSAPAVPEIELEGFGIGLR